jgi:hypothetical protein
MRTFDALIILQGLVLRASKAQTHRSKLVPLRNGLATSLAAKGALWQ